MRVEPRPQPFERDGDVVMKLHLKENSGRRFPRFAWRTALLLGVILGLAEVGYLMAQGVLPNSADLLRLAIRGDAFQTNQDLFLAFRRSALIPIFGIAILSFIAISLGHFFKFGPKDMSAPSEEDEIPWWDLSIRVVHGLMVVVFLILFITGLMITFGRYFVSPGVFLRQSHEIAGFLFVPLLAYMVVTWLKEAMFKAYDLDWLKNFGGYLGSKAKLTSGKFNAGQKLWFWVMAVTGILLSYSGLMLFFQIGNMEDMKFQVVLHMLSAMPMMLMFLVHLYMTTLGTKGTLMGMIHGRFSKAAAESYHSEASELKAVESK